MKWIIYLIENLIENKIYVGCTQDLKARLRAHKSQKHKSIRGGLYLVKELSFSFDKKEAYEFEKQWIEKLKSTDPLIGYNEREGGFYGYKYPLHSKCRNKTQDQCLRQSISLKEFWKNNKHPRLGISHSEDSKNKMSKSQHERAMKGDKPFLGQKHSEESKKRMSDTRKAKIASGEIVLTGRKMSEETKQKISHSKKMKSILNKSSAY